MLNPISSQYYMMVGVCYSRYLIPVHIFDRMMRARTLFSLLILPREDTESPREDAGGLSREYILRIPSVS